MSNIDRAADIIYRSLSGKYGDFGHQEDVAQALADDGLLAPAPQIIRTDDEYDALDPDSIVLDDKGRVRLATSMWRLPAVKVAEGAHVRACREALEGGPL